MNYEDVRSTEQGNRGSQENRCREVQVMRENEEKRGDHKEVRSAGEKKGSRADRIGRDGARRVWVVFILRRRRSWREG